MKAMVKSFGAVGMCLMLLTGASDTWAATFCVVGPAIPPQCLYESVNDCIRASDSINTFCGINPETHLSYYGSQRYCTVDSARITQCLFSSWDECSRAASRQAAICIDREAKADDVNPFKYDQRLLH